MRSVNHGPHWHTWSMSEPFEVATPTVEAQRERAARQFTTFIDVTMRRLSSLALSVAVVTGVIGLATYASGFLVFDGAAETAWILVGGVICLIPFAFGVAAWIYVRITLHHIPNLLSDVRSLIGQSRQAFAVVIDHDSGQPVTTTARSFTKLSNTIPSAPGMYPSLRSAVRAGMKVPWLVAITVVSALVLGAFGTMLFLVGLLS